MNINQKLVFKWIKTSMNKTRVYNFQTKKAAKTPKEPGLKI